GTAAEERGGGGADPGIFAVGGDAGTFWGYGGELAGRNQERCQLRHFRDAAVCGTGYRCACSGSQPDEKIGAGVQFVEFVGRIRLLRRGRGAAPLGKARHGEIWRLSKNVRRRVLRALGWRAD